MTEKNQSNEIQSNASSSSFSDNTSFASELTSDSTLALDDEGWGDPTNPKEEPFPEDDDEPDIIQDSYSNSSSSSSSSISTTSTSSSSSSTSLSFKKKEKKIEATSTDLEKKPDESDVEFIKRAGEYFDKQEKLSDGIVLSKSGMAEKAKNRQKFIMEEYLKQCPLGINDDNEEEEELAQAIKESKAIAAKDQRARQVAHAQAASFGFTVEKVSDDGDCLYHSISDQLACRYGIHVSGPNLRRIGMQYMSDNPDRYADSLTTPTYFTLRHVSKEVLIRVGKELTQNKAKYNPFMPPGKDYNINQIFNYFLKVPDEENEESNRNKGVRLLLGNINISAKEKVKSHKEAMLENRALKYADEVDKQVISDVLKLSIATVQPAEKDDTPILYKPQGVQACKVFIVYENSNHYNSLRGYPEHGSSEEIALTSYLTELIEPGIILSEQQHKEHIEQLVKVYAESLPKSTPSDEKKETKVQLSTRSSSSSSSSLSTSTGAASGSTIAPPLFSSSIPDYKAKETDVPSTSPLSQSAPIMPLTSHMLDSRDIHLLNNARAGDSNSLEMVLTHAHLYQNFRYKDGTTLLHLFASNGNVPAIHTLIRAGADPTVSGGYPAHPPFVFASEKLHNDAKQWLIFYAAQHERLLQIEVSDIDGARLGILRNKLITSLVYEHYRGNEKNVQKLKDYLDHIDPKYQEYKIEKFTKEITEEETSQHTFFGSYPSDDSDSDEEKRFLQEPGDLRRKKLEAAASIAKKANIKKLVYSRSPGVRKKEESKKREHKKTKEKREKRRALLPQLKKGDLRIGKEDPSDLFNKGTRVKLSQTGNKEQVESDRQKLNQLCREKPDFTSDDIAKLGLKTQFYVAQYRGIMYLTTHWSKPQRMRHRGINEIGLPVFSQAAYRRAKLSPDALHDVQQQAQYIHKLTEAAREIAKTLLETRKTDPVSYKDKMFDNLADLLQEIYTTNYSAFHNLLKTDEHLKKLFPEGANPFVSTGDRPYHALKYAYGIKPYQGYEHQRLRPRWRRDGRAERPYSGKVYVSLHPIEDYNHQGPTHVPSLNNTGRVAIDSEIIAEYETTFPGLMAPDRVVYTHIAKYFSFSGPYKTMYGYKYGLTEDLYKTFKSVFEKFPPHTEGNKKAKRLLGEWLCAYYELHLIAIAQEKVQEKPCAEGQQNVLIYRTFNGFSLELGPATLLTPQTPKNMRSTVTDARAKRKLGAHSPSADKLLADRQKTLSALLSRLQISEDVSKTPIFSPVSASVEPTVLLPLLEAKEKIGEEDDKEAIQNMVEINLGKMLAEELSGYIAKDDLEWQGAIYTLLGLSYNDKYKEAFNGMNDDERLEAIKSFYNPKYILYQTDSLEDFSEDDDLTELLGTSDDILEDIFQKLDLTTTRKQDDLSSTSSSSSRSPSPSSSSSSSPLRKPEVIDDTLIKSPMYGDVGPSLQTASLRQPTQSSGAPRLLAVHSRFLGGVTTTTPSIPSGVTISQSQSQDTSQEVLPPNREKMNKKIDEEETHSP